MEIPEIPHSLCHFGERETRALQLTLRNPQPCQLFVDAGLDTAHVFNSKGVKYCLGSIWKDFFFLQLSLETHKSHQQEAE